MKKRSEQKVHHKLYLRKLLLRFEIMIIIIVIGASNALASPADDPVKSSAKDFPSGDELQQITVTGTVTDASTGGPMPGVNVIIKGTSFGALTDLGGRYSLAVPDQNVTLVFSFIGYDTQEQVVAGRTTLNIALVPVTTALDEVIVTGYGTQKKSDLTGSVVRVTMDQKTSLANLNLSQALSGATAGVNVQGVGLAGAEPTLGIRGRTSLSASDAPLIILDGIIYNGSINNINVNDIESVDILKDASAAAVYGSRSANGVMIITTKKGKTEKPLISFNMYYGYQDMTNNPMRVMNAEEYAIRLVDYYYQQDLYTWYKTKPTSATGKPVRPDITNRELVAARLRSQEERDNYLAGNEIDWVDEVLQIAPIQNYNASISGKSDRSNYYASASYTNEEGIQLNDKFSRITLFSNVESKITNWLTIGLNTSYSFRDYSGIEANLGNARSCSPLANNKIGLPNYDLYLTGEAYMTYPLVYLFIDNKDTRNDLFLLGNAKITVPWIKGLTYEFNYSNRYYTRRNNTFHPVNSPSGSGNKGLAVRNPSEERNWIYNNIITYLRTFGSHQVNATLLYSQEGRNAESSTINASGFDNPVLGFNNVGLGTTVTVASTAWKENSISYMGRLNYSFKSRYLLTATVRRDGFSGFGPTRKFATFPSVSLGWVVSDESFMRDVRWLYLKLRTSYGKNGNQGIGRYSSFSRMTADAYVFGAATAIAVYPSTLGNADLGWESTTSMNLGLDFGLLNRRISGSVDVYKATTTDVLVSRALPPTTGYSSVWTNIGAIDNKGIEFEVTSKNLTGRLGWETNFVFSLNRDKITKLYGDENDKDVGNSWFVGEPISAIYDFEMMGGVWTEAELYAGQTYNNWYPGQYKYVDQNGDGVIEPNLDRKVIGYRTPSYRFSINNTLNYKNFTFSFFVNSIQGGKKYFMENNASVVNVDFRSDNVLRINASAVRPYWTPDNGVTNATGVYNTPPQASGIYESRSFVRLQDVSLSYRLSPELLNTLKLQDCQVYIASKNPYTWTKWSGWDPEAWRSDSQNSPLMRNITAGFRVTF
jgi:TonB-linked SusC/RagA family outer membrane protein